VSGVGGGILIADGNRARAADLVAACQLRGLRTRQAPHGPAALEMALAELPELVVATDDLALIEADRLAEILRSNPRTQAVPFLFLGVQPKHERQSPFDEKLDHGAEPAEVARRAGGMLARRSRVDEVARGRGEEELAGRLAQVPLADVLQLLHLNRRSGTLELARRVPGGRDERGRVLLRDGEVVQAQVGAVEDEKAVFRLLAWSEGSFAFRPGAAPADTRITAPTRALLLEGLRHLDEWKRVRSRLPGLDAEVRLRIQSGELPNVVQPLTQEVLLLLEIYSRVGDVVDHSSYPDYQVLRTLHTLIERGIVELREGPERAAGGPALFSAPQVRRLHDWLRADGPHGEALPEAKLLLFSASASASAAFLQRLARLPDLEVEETGSAGIGPEELAPVARIGVSGTASIELLHVPAGPGFAPLWPLAAHRALAALLLSDAATAAAGALADCERALRGIPGLRRLHVVLLGEGAAADARGLREALGLPEEAGLVALGAGEGSEAPLRGLLASVVP
jgi:hypothetical protein